MANATPVTQGTPVIDPAVAQSTPAPAPVEQGLSLPAPTLADRLINNPVAKPEEVR